MCKIYAIMIMGAMGGAAGTFYAQKYLYLDPPIAYSIHLSVEMLLVTIVGGMGTIFGPLVGAFVLHTVNEVARHFIDTPGFKSNCIWSDTDSYHWISSKWINWSI